ncbi:MAG TPA: metallophosphoesterase [Bryobacteraceae bacterium]|nr:metallophosphoesterase [Bryobacteraceae bacterium]
MHTLHLFPDFYCAVASTCAALYMARRLLRSTSVQGSPALRATIWSSCALLIAAFIAAWLFASERIAAQFPVALTQFIQAFGLASGFCVVCWSVMALVAHGAPPFREDRRQVFRAAGALMLASPPVVTTFGIVTRNDFRVSEVKLAIPNLARDLHGMRIVQVTDVHLSTFLSEKELARAIDMANGARAHLAVMTGDLITRPGDPLDACIRQLGRLRADAGVYGCLGNHEIYCRDQDYVTTECGRRGVRFLRSEATDLRFGNAIINLAGVDYQAMHKPYLEDAAGLVANGKLNLLLSHNPDVFRTAAAQGWQAVLAGHTHGGQVNVEILHQNMNVARFFTPWVRGAYYLPGSAIYVSSGIGTIGMPIRLGAPPEISVVELCAS